MNDKPAVQLTYKEPAPGQQNNPKLPSIVGLIKSDTTEPSGRPRSFFEQFRIFNNRLYWYDTATNAWFNSSGGGGGGTPAGSDTEVQYNNADAFGSSPHFRFDPTTYGAPALVVGDGSGTDFYIVYAGSSTPHFVGPWTFDNNVSFGANAQFANVATILGSLRLFGTSAANEDFLDVAHVTGSTTTATPTPIIVHSIQTNETIQLQAFITARRTGGTSGSAGDCASYVRRATYKNHSTTAYALVGSIQDDYTAEDQAGWDVSFDLSGNVVRLVVTGATNNNVEWFATIMKQSFTP